jgi:hypothetical protein
MRAILYIFTIGFVAAVLFLAVHQVEPDRRYRLGLKILIVCLVIAAIVTYCLRLLTK